MPDDKANQEKDTAGYRTLTRKCIVTGRYIRLNILNILKSAVTAVWSYVAELLFDLLILVGAVKASDRVVREMMGL